MALILPDFSHPFLTQFTICAFPPEGDFKEKIQAAGGFEEDAIYGDRHWLHLVLEIDDDGDPHIHFDAVRSFGQGKPEPTSTVQAIEQALAVFADDELFARVIGKYEIAKGHLPKRGLIPNLRFATEVGGETLNMTGAKMTSSGDTFAELEWSTAPDGSVEVEISEFVVLNFGNDLLVEAEQQLHRWLDWLAFSGKEEK